MPTTDTAPTTRTLRTIGGLFLLAFVVRASCLLVMPEAFSSDPDGYRSIAIHWKNTGEYAWPNSTVKPYPTAFRPPLYPLLLALLTTEQEIQPWRVALCHALLGAMTVTLTWIVATDLGLNRGAWLAACWVLFDPLLIEQSRLYMTETLAACLSIAGVFCLVRWQRTTAQRWLLISGFITGLAVLCRPVFAVWGIFNLLWMLWALRGQQRWKAALLYSLSMVICMSPWWMRNYVYLQKTVLTTSHGGYTLLLGNNPDFYAYVRQGSWTTAWMRQPNDYIAEHTLVACCSTSELKQDDHFSQLAWQCIRQDPAGFLLACLFRQFQLLTPLPSQISTGERWSRTLLRYAVAVWYVAQYGCLLLACWNWQRVQGMQRAMPWMCSLILAVALVHTFYWTNLRMRAPLIPVLAILAATGFSTQAHAYQKDEDVPAIS